MKPIHWINSAGGDFTDGADWSGGVVPGAGDDAVIDAQGTYRVTLSSAETVRSLILNDAGATVSLGNGANLTLGSDLTLKGGRFDLGDGAIISGGTLRDKKGKFLWHSGTLDGVTYDGPLNMRNQASIIYVGPSGLVLTGSDGTGRGTATLTRESELAFKGTQTFDNATIYLTNSDLSGDAIGSGSVLTLGKNITVIHIASGGGMFGSAVVNEGVINNTGGSFFVDPDEFTNQGTITVSNGGGIEIFSSGFTNLVGGTLTGGHYEIDAGSTLELTNVGVKDETVVTDDAVITLSGVGSVLKSLSGAYHGLAPIEATLTTIGAAGTLKLLAGRDWSSTLSMANEGTLVLGGGTFVAGGLTNDGVIQGRGVIDVAVADAGTIKAVGGTLDLTRAISGNGALQVNAKAVLKIEAAAAASLTATFNGVGGDLKLGDAASFAATIAGFAAGDTIDLLGQAATSATLQTGNQLVVKNGGQTVTILQLTGDYSGSAFAVASDGRGGSNITVTAGLLAQAMSAMVPAAAGHAGYSAEAWRPHPAMLAGPRAMVA